MNTNFYNEIKEQPSELIKTLEAYSKERYASLHRAAKLIRSADALVMSGMGTSYYVCLSVLEELAQTVRVNAIQSYQLLKTGCAGLRDGDLLILISQSGESGEIVELCRKTAGKNKIIAITNEPNSTLAKAAEVVLPLYSHKEISITNCTYTASLAVLQMLAACVSDTEPEAVAAKLREGAKEAERLLETEKSLFRIADSLGKKDRIHFIGCNGLETTLAEQAALTFKEGADCNAQCFNVGAFRHGPVELCGKEHVAILYVSNAESHNTMKALAKRMDNYGSTVIAISNLQMPVNTIDIRCESCEAFGIAAAIVTELLLIKAAYNRGKEAGIFTISGKVCKEY